MDSTNSKDNEGPNHLEREESFRNLRCFCGCTSFTHEQIEHIATMNVVHLLHHKTGIDLFKNFLRIGCRTDTSEVYMLIDCYILCDKVMKRTSIIHDPDIQNELLSLCPTYTWERRISSSFQKKPDEIVNILKDLQQECVQNVELHNDYDRFRRELLRKIHKHS